MEQTPPGVLSDSDKILYAERLKLASTLIVAEYASLKSQEESAMRGSAFTTRWFSSTLGVGLGLGFVAIYTSLQPGNVGSGMLNSLIYVVFGFTLPALSCIAAWTWLGDLHRLERLGGQVRSIETRVSEAEGISDLIGIDPIRQERFSAQGMITKSSKAVKSGAQFYATSGLFFGGVTLSSIIYMTWHFQTYPNPLDLPQLGALLATIGMFAVFNIVSFWFASQIVQLHKSTPDMNVRK